MKRINRRKFLTPYNDQPETILARNSISFQYQLVHHECTKISNSDGSIFLDFNETDTTPDTIDKRKLTIKVNSPVELNFQSHEFNFVDISLHKAANCILYTLSLERKNNSKKAAIDFVAK